MRFAIRDDDTSYFTRADELDRVWRDFLPRVPVSLAVIPASLEPFHLGDSARYYQGTEPFPITANSELVAWLREKSRNNSIAVLCHGYTHEYRRTPSTRLCQEYIWKPYERLRHETAAGKAMLEAAIGEPVDTFVPPGNAISGDGLRAVGESFQNVLTTLPLRRPQDLQPNWPHVEAYARRLFYQLRYGIPNPFVEELAGVRMAPSFSATKSTLWDHIHQKLVLCHRLNADFVVAVHYWEVDQRLKELMRRLIDAADRLGFEFATCPQVFEAAASATGRLRPARHLTA